LKTIVDAPYSNALMIPLIILGFGATFMGYLTNEVFLGLGSTFYQNS
jgi:hypothetical protein